MNDKDKAARAQHEREVAQLADFNYGHLEVGDAVRGEAAAESWKPNIVLIANACEKYEEGSAVGLPEHGMAQAFQYLLSKMPVSARAADAPSEPSGLTLEQWLDRVDENGWTERECIYDNMPDVLKGWNAAMKFGKSRAADALDSQPTEPWTRTEDRLPPVETPVLILHSDDVKIGEIRWENPSHEETFEAFMYWDDPNDDGQSWDWLEVTHWMPIPPAPASSQPTSPAINYVRSEWESMCRKAAAVLNKHIVPDGISDHEALNELYGIFDSDEYRATGAIEQDACEARQAVQMSIDRSFASSQPTDGGVRND